MWLPITKKEVLSRGWDTLDVILFTGDAYVDHPSFGAAVIGRIIESYGYTVAIVPQPNWNDDLRDFRKMGEPRLFFGVTSGNMDSMVNHYTANKRLRSNDAYTPGGKAGFRPDYATTVYTRILKELFPETPVVIGGIEASLRRVTHYDYWQDKLLPSILYTSGADMLVYGMGEKPLAQLLKLLSKGIPFSNLQAVEQTAILTGKDKALAKNKNWETVELNSHQACLSDKLKYAANFRIIEEESNKMEARRITQLVHDKILVINPPFPPLSEKETDYAHDLPYMRMPHPKYRNKGSIPAYDMIKFSVNTHRGCFGGCSFCTISAHQGKFIASRSEQSIKKEVENLTKHPEFKGTISDMGGPSANMYKMKGINEKVCRNCKRPSCISPFVCSNLDTSHASMTKLYRDTLKQPGVKKVFIGSGIRYDLLSTRFNKNADPSLDEYTEQIVRHHISGRLKVAPEHTSDETLRIMRKPSFKYFNEFKEKFDSLNKKNRLQQELVPYFISSHPGCNDTDMANLAIETKKHGYKLKQVQDFTPTPMTVATVIYYSGVHPYTLKPVYTAKTKSQKQNQHKFFFWYKNENKKFIISRLKQLGKPEYIRQIFQ